MTRSLLGCHWIRTHPDNRDLPHIEAMQYRSVKLFEWHWRDRNACGELLTVLPKDALILARDHPLSEQKQDAMRDPVGTGTRHANEWAVKVAMGEVHTPVERTFFLGINEPNADSGDRNAIDLYTEAFLRRLKVHGLRGGAFNFSTGHPRTVDGTPATKADYTVFERSHRAIVDGKHIAVLHIYGTAAVPLAPGHYDRLRACPWQDVTWIVGEFGIDEHVIGGGAHLGFHHHFNGRLNDYCQWLDTAIMGTHDKRIHSYQVFTYDHSHPWSGFDIHPIRDALEAYDWQHVKQQQPSGPTVPPKPPPGGGAIGYVNAPAGANVRVEPIDGDVVIAVPFGEQIHIVSMDSKTGWMQVTYAGKTGWMVPRLISMEPPDAPKPTPQPPVQLPSGIIDPLTALAFMQVESGNRAFENGLLVIRFEVHVFKARLKNDALFDKHFKFTPGNYGEQYWRASPDGAWIHAHGSQADRHALLRFARSLNDTAALRSTGMGLGQVMGDNHARIGYATPQAMFRAFSNLDFGGTAQLMGFVNYVLSDPKLLDALRRRDWFTAVQGYNGIGQEHIYVPALEKALDKIRNAVGT